MSDEKARTIEMGSTNVNKDGDHIDVTPAKSFFVHMLTRDIALSDAILDLLDNCVDGILRAKLAKDDDIKPYASFWAKITIKENMFVIEDNCGGIPWEKRQYAFKLGKAADQPTDKDSTIGTYGIGMKRAMFKIGEHSVVYTKTTENAYKVTIEKPWLSNDSWELPISQMNKDELNECGTRIVIDELLPEVSFQFIDADFIKELKKQISTLYAFILAKGFVVKVNEEDIIGRPTKLIFSRDTEIMPFIYKDCIDEVEVFLAVGFTRALPSREEMDENDESGAYSSLDAGWTVVCNDRAVLYCNRDELTGWGEAGVPLYHTQFIAISGIVEFRCSNSRKLPMTTTKRGIDASSRIYLRVKNKMREGMKLFINYTNRWKNDWEEGKKKFTQQSAFSLTELKEKVNKQEISLTLRRDGDSVFSPSLPMPAHQDPLSVRISFKALKDDVYLVANYLYGEDDCPEAPNCNKIGEESFKYVLRKAKQ